MATEAGSLYVTLSLVTKEFVTGINTARNKLESFNQNASSWISAHKLAITAALTGVAIFAKKSIDAYGEQEQAIARLTQALGNQGLAIDSNVEKYTALANELQNLTGVNDDTVVSGIALLTNFGVQQDQMEKVTKAAVDLSAATGMDLQSAFMAMGKAASGNVGALSRYIGKIPEGISASEQFSWAVDKVTKSMGGTALAQAKTFSGQLAILQQSFGDLQKVVGQFLSGAGAGILPMINSWVQSFTSALQIIYQTQAQFASFGSFLQTYIFAAIGAVTSAVIILVQKFFEVLSFIPGLSTGAEMIIQKLEKIKQETEDYYVAITATRINAADAAGKIVQYEKQKQEAVAVTTQTTFDTSAAMTKWMSDQRAMDYDDFQKSLKGKDTAYAAWGKMFLTTTKEINEKAIRIADQMFDNFGQGISDMIMANRKFSDVIKKLWQDMARAIIAEIAKMIAKWLAFLALRGVMSMFGGPAGAAIATGAFSAAGGAQFGGMIGEPSVVTGLRSGKSMLAGEAGPEQIVPVGGNGFFSGPVGAGAGGGSITVNISGQFIEGNDAQWQRLIRDRVVPEIRRFSMSVPVGPFNRRRGVS